MKAMLARLLDRPKFFNDTKVLTTRNTVVYDEYNPLKPITKLRLSGWQTTKD